MSTASASQVSPRWPPKPLHVFEWEHDDNNATVLVLSTDVLLLQLLGTLSAPALNVLAPAITSFLSRSGAGHLFCDAETLDAYDTDLRDGLVELMAEHRDKWVDVHILYTSPVVGMAVTGAGLMTRGAVKGYRDVEAFQEAAEQALASS